MGLSLSIFIIISALIIFLSLYYISLKNETILYKKRPSPVDLEMAEEIGVPIYNWRKKELKYKYNKTFIRSFSCNPNTLFVYWEINDPDYYKNEQILRLYQEEENNYLEIKLTPETDNWYLQGIKSGKTYRTIVGYLKHGEFLPLAVSSPVTTPQNRPSNIIDQRWRAMIESTDQLKFYEEKASLSHFPFDHNRSSNKN